MEGKFVLETQPTRWRDDFFPYSWQKNWDSHYWLNWHERNWFLCLPIALLYVLLVFVGVNLMKDRKPFNLRLPLAIWSGTLAVFSTCGSIYFLPEIFNVLKNDGFHSAACENSYKTDKDYMFWAWLFTWSKILEFGDTAFIVLRKQKLSFLHWFHHAMTVICVFAYFPDNCSINRWTGAMNFLIHSIMYSYYACKAFKIIIPRTIALIITISQISQMFIGFYVAGYIFIQKINNVPCKMSLKQSIFSISIYSIYFILFLNFFFTSYFKEKAKRKIS